MSSISQKAPESDGLGKISTSFEQTMSSSLQALILFKKSTAKKSSLQV